MVTNETVSKLQDMHLSTMARRFKEQLDNPQMKELSFEDRFGLLVDAEWATRKNNHLARLIKKAGYAIPGACMEDIEYLPERKLDKAHQADFLLIHPRVTQHRSSRRHRSWQDLYRLCLGHGRQQELLHRPLYPAAGSARGDRHCPRRRHLPGVHEEVQED